MRLLIVGTLKGQLTTATKMAMDRGAAVTHVETNDQALAVLRGRGADLLMVDVALDIGDLVSRLELVHIHVPIVACGVESTARRRGRGEHRPRRGRCDSCRRERIHPAAAGSRADRSRARCGRR